MSSGRQDNNKSISTAAMVRRSFQQNNKTPSFEINLGGFKWSSMVALDRLGALAMYLILSSHFRSVAADNLSTSSNMQVASNQTSETENGELTHDDLILKIALPFFVGIPVGFVLIVAICYYTNLCCGYFSDSNASSFDEEEGMELNVMKVETEEAREKEGLLKKEDKGKEPVDPEYAAKKKDREEARRKFGFNQPPSTKTDTSNAVSDLSFHLSILNK